MFLRTRGMGFDQIGHEMGITAQAAHGLVKRGLAAQSRGASHGRSVKASQNLPHDKRGGVNLDDKGRRPPAGGGRRKRTED